MNKSELLEEWNELLGDYKKLEATNVKYLKQLDEVAKLQQVCQKHINHQKYRMKILKQNLAKAKKKNLLNEEDVEVFNEKLMQREVDLQGVEQVLPKQTGKYLKLVLGDINVSFMDKEAKFKYKDQYEKFKLINHFIAFGTLMVLVLFPTKPLEQFYLAFLVWYYSTVTMRESILKTNGSRIKGWWSIHHVLSVVCSIILLIWPSDETWLEFRYQFYWYNIYNCFLQYLQFRYQRGALYRLKALGERDNMDITIEGFHSWMWRGLTFLLPMLFIGYLFQLANAIGFYKLSYHPKATWHVMAAAIMFFVFFVGNSVTTMMVVPEKVRQKMMLNYRVMRNRLYNAVGEKVKIRRG